MKVIFLDFDGPIIPRQSHDNHRGKMEKAWPSCVAALNRITDATGAKIVISSSWRYIGEENATILLRAWGVTGDVIGITTTELESRWTPDNLVWQAVVRGVEIQDWIDKNPKCESFVILDDDADMAHLEPRLILTPFEVGLTESDADRAIEMLSQ
jgi:hypothetical protein